MKLEIGIIPISYLLTLFGKKTSPLLYFDFAFERKLEKILKFVILYAYFVNHIEICSLLIFTFYIRTEEVLHVCLDKKRSPPELLIRSMAFEMLMWPTGVVLLMLVFLSSCFFRTLCSRSNLLLRTTIVLT